MSKKRDRRSGGPVPARPVEKEPPPPPQRRSGLFGSAAQSPYPPFGVSVAAGFRAVGRRPLLRALTLLAPLAVWAGFIALGTAPPPQALVLLTGLPPVHVSLDVALVNQAAGTAVSTTAMVLGSAAVRALALGMFALLLIASLREEPAGPSLRRLPRVAGILFLVISVEFALVLAVPLLVQSVAGPALGNLGVIAALILGLHYLGMAPAIAAAEPDPAAEILRRSVRAARLPGPRHLLLVVAYFSFVFWAATITPAGPNAPITPSPAVWGFALVGSLVHIGALGTFLFRWLAVRDQVPRAEPRR